ncbi:MAG: glycine--tRNA ligase subunit beta, partial [Chloroflexota bacterium]
RTVPVCLPHELLRRHLLLVAKTRRGKSSLLLTLARYLMAAAGPQGHYPALVLVDPHRDLARAALGLVQNLLAHQVDLDLRQALEMAAAGLPIAASPESLDACLEFIVERLRNLLLEQGLRYDLVDAVLAEQGAYPARAARAAKELAGWVTRPDWNSILPAYARCVRITRDQKERFAVDAGAFVEPAERELYTALETAEAAPRQSGSVNDFLNAFLPMIPAVNRFFDDVLVMAEDPRLRSNRLGLLQRIAALAHGVADMSRLEGF